uniref:C1q domain-containing protein n=1 Tax=Dicentrarchus labrax TaxID=13489 RepID=A0A8P4GLX2_DICLA
MFSHIFFSIATCSVSISKKKIFLIATYSFLLFCCGGSLYRNENKIVSWYNVNQNHPSSGSNSAILQLQVGDYVNVRLWHNRVISDNVNKYSTFSGFLLFAVETR